MRKRKHKASIGLVPPFGLADGKSKAIAFSALEDFANLGDTVEDLGRFQTKHHGIGPIDALQLGAEGKPAREIGLSAALHPLILNFRDLLQHVWRGSADRDPRILDILMGLNTEILDPEKWRGGVPGEVAPLTRFFSQAAMPALERLRRANIAPSRLEAVWTTGDFRFVTASWFHWAVYAVFRESWRARVCPQCRRYFIADRPPQRFCSTACSGEARNARNRSWWRHEGKEWRNKQARRAKSQRKRGK